MVGEISNNSHYYNKYNYRISDDIDEQNASLAKANLFKYY